MDLHWTQTPEGRKKMARRMLVATYKFDELLRDDASGLWTRDSIEKAIRP